MKAKPFTLVSKHFDVLLLEYEDGQFNLTMMVKGGVLKADSVSLVATTGRDPKEFGKDADDGPDGDKVFLILKGEIRQ
jgi:hypothetical protein